MTITNGRQEKIRHELQECREEFRKLLETLSEDDLKRKSHNPGWTNGEILFHMLLGFIVVYLLLPTVNVFERLPKSWSKMFANILNFSTPLFNVINAWGATMGGRVFDRSGLREKFDKITDGLIGQLAAVKEDEWAQGMYYPNKWDGLFDEFMTREKLFNYPIKHFKFHAGQIKRQARSILSTSEV